MFIKQEELENEIWRSKLNYCHSDTDCTEAMRDTSQFTYRETYEHIPLKESPPAIVRHEKHRHVKTIIPPFELTDDTGKVICRSHWLGDFKTGKFQSDLPSPEANGSDLKLTSRLEELIYAIANQPTFKESAPPEINDWVVDAYLKARYEVLKFDHTSGSSPYAFLYQIIKNEFIRLASEHKQERSEFHAYQMETLSQEYPNQIKQEFYISENEIDVANEPTNTNKTEKKSNNKSNNKTGKWQILVNGIAYKDQMEVCQKFQISKRYLSNILTGVHAPHSQLGITSIGYPNQAPLTWKPDDYTHTDTNVRLSKSPPKQNTRKPKSKYFNREASKTTYEFQQGQEFYDLDSFASHIGISANSLVKKLQTDLSALVPLATGTCLYVNDNYIGEIK